MKSIQMWIFSPSLSVFFENGTLENWVELHTNKLALKQNKIIKKRIWLALLSQMVGKTSIFLVSTIKTSSLSGTAKKYRRSICESGF